jgi:hypothetical protein
MDAEQVARELYIVARCSDTHEIAYEKIAAALLSFAASETDKVRKLLLSPDDLEDCRQTAEELVMELLAEHDQRAEFLQKAEDERDNLRECLRKFTQKCHYHADCPVKEAIALLGDKP